MAINKNTVHHLLKWNWKSEARFFSAAKVETENLACSFVVAGNLVFFHTYFLIFRFDRLVFKTGCKSLAQFSTLQDKTFTFMIIIKWVKFFHFFWAKTLKITSRRVCKTKSGKAKWMRYAVPRRSCTFSFCAHSSATVFTCGQTGHISEETFRAWIFSFQDAIMARNTLLAKLWFFISWLFSEYNFRKNYTCIHQGGILSSVKLLSLPEFLEYTLPNW